MNVKSFIVSLSCAMLVGCIAEEAQNTECDIVEVTFPQGVKPDAINYFAPIDTTLNAYPLKIVVPNGWDLKTLVIVYKVTHGAVMTWEGSGPENLVDYNDTIFATVTSQDRNWQKRYAIMVSHPSKRSLPPMLSFEDCSIIPSGNNLYQQFYENVEGERMDIWASGNAGFAMTGQGKTLDSYPTYQSEEGEGINGSRCAVLQTCSTGGFGKMGKKPMAAGNMFLGVFDVTQAMNDALLTTHFGITTYQKPKTVKGWFKYKPGETFFRNDNGNLVEVPGRVDSCTVHCVFFKTDDELKYLDGHQAGDGYVDSHVVAHGMFGTADTVEEWTEFSFDLDYESYGAEINAIDLKNGIYKMALVFSSSKYGDIYEGALNRGVNDKGKETFLPGSTFMVDDVEVIFNEQ
ncbi:MAG: PCMD domain-containing protein [Bacteroidales bacterium]|nr:PCMD domain-containing protein [Bacteroidales bacterium]